MKKKKAQPNCPDCEKHEQMGYCPVCEKIHSPVVARRSVQTVFAASLAHSIAGDAPAPPLLRPICEKLASGRATTRDLLTLANWLDFGVNP
jgi:hypothetical protein